MADRRDRQQEALDTLCDLSMTTGEALAKFEKLSRRWKPINRAFLLEWGLRIRARKAEPDHA